MCIRDSVYGQLDRHRAYRVGRLDPDDRRATATALCGNRDALRALLAVAAWLDAEGGKGEGDAAPLLSRMMALSVAYQRERQNVEGDDLTSLVIRALGMIVGKIVRDDGAVSAVKSISAIKKEIRFIPTVLVTGAAHSLIGAYEIDINPDMVTTRRIGKVLNKMRFIRHRVAGGGNRGWMISLDDVIRWAESCLLYTSPSPRD